MASFKNALHKLQLAVPLVPHFSSMAAVPVTPICCTLMKFLVGRNLARFLSVQPSLDRVSNLKVVDTFKTASTTIEERLWNCSMRVRGSLYVEVVK